MSSSSIWSFVSPQLPQYQEYLSHEKPWKEMAKKDSSGTIVINCLEDILKIEGWQKNEIIAELFNKILVRLSKANNRKNHSKKHTLNLNHSTRIRFQNIAQILQVQQATEPAPNQEEVELQKVLAESVRIVRSKNKNSPSDLEKALKESEEFELKKAQNASLDGGSDLAMQKILEASEESAKLDSLKRKRSNHDLEKALAESEQADLKKVKLENNVDPRINALISEIEQELSEGNYFSKEKIEEFRERQKQFVVHINTPEYGHVDNLIDSIIQSWHVAYKKRISREILKKKGDGNCLFHSFADGLPKSIGNFNHQTMRDEINKYLVENCKTDIKLRNFIINAVEEYNRSINDKITEEVEGHIAATTIDLEHHADNIGLLLEESKTILTTLFGIYREQGTIQDNVILDKFKLLEDLKDPFLDFQIGKKLTEIEFFKLSEEYYTCSPDEQAERFGFVTVLEDMLKEVSKIDGFNEKEQAFHTTLQDFAQSNDINKVSKEVKKLLANPLNFSQVVNVIVDGAKKGLHKIEDIKKFFNNKLIDKSSEEASIDAYVKLSKNPGFWGSHPEIYAFSRIFSSRVCVYTLEKIAGKDKLSNMEYLNDLVSLDGIPAKCSINLQYENGNHFNLIREKVQEIK